LKNRSKKLKFPETCFDIASRTSETS
jgi:hypothetical protein